MKPVAPSCKDDAGVKFPIIDPKRCEAKADCVRVCPYDVFELRALTAAEKRELGVLGRLKVAAHGGKQAFAARVNLPAIAMPERPCSLIACRDSR